jgi:hypothetical protein
LAYDTATGLTRWVATFDGAAHGDDRAVALVVGPNGSSVYVTGSITNNDSGKDYATIAYSAASGDVLWTAVYNGQWNGDDWPTAIAINPEGTRLFVTGREDEDSLTSEAATVAYLADTGTELWVARYSGPGKHENQPRGLAVTPDGGGVLVTVTSLSGFPYSTADYVTILYGAMAGEARWSARYDGPGKDDDEPAALAVDPDGLSVFATGLSSGYRGSSASDYDYATVAYSLPVLPTVVSRKAHGAAGTYDIDLPLTGVAGIECRSGGSNGDYALVFTFADRLVSVGGAGVTSGTGSVANSGIDSSDPRHYLVNLTNVSNAQTITVTLFGVNDGTNTGEVAVEMGLLIGDVNASGRVDAADVSLVRQQALQPVTSSDFRADINATGRIDAADVSVARQQTLTSLP